MAGKGQVVVVRRLAKTNAKFCRISDYLKN